MYSKGTGRVTHTKTLRYKEEESAVTIERGGRDEHALGGDFQPSFLSNACLPPAPSQLLDGQETTCTVVLRR